MKATWLVIGVALVFASGCVRPDWIEQTLVTVDVTGVWRGTASGSSGSTNQIVLTLQQNGPKVTGRLDLSGTGAGVAIPVEGIVNGDLFRFQDKRGSITAELQVSGDEMTGSGTRSSPAAVGFGGSMKFELHRQP